MTGEQPATIGAKRNTRWKQWTAAVIVGYCILACAIVGYRARSADRDVATLDFRDFWLTAQHFRLTGEIRDDLGVHNYPPCFTILMAPFSLLPLQPAAVLFTLFSITCFGVSVRALYKAVGDHAGSAISIALLAVFPYIHATIVLGQVNLIVTAAVIAALAALLRRRDLFAGTLLATAAAIKVIPILALGWIVLRGRFLAALSTVIALLMLTVILPVTIIGGGETIAQYRGFLERAAAGHSAYQTIHAEKPQKAKYTNVALPMILRRVLTATDGDPGGSAGPLLVNIAQLPLRWVWAVYVGFAIVVGVSTIGATLARSSTGHRTGHDRDVALFGAWCAAMLLASPMVWTHHLVMAFPTVFAIVRRAKITGASQSAVGDDSLAGRSAARFVFAVWCAALLSLAWPAARAAGCPLLGVLVIWCGCTWLAIRDQPAPIESPAAAP